MAVRAKAWSVVVPHDPRGARLGRQRLAEELGELIGQALLVDAVAVVGELLGNAVRHASPLAGGVIRLEYRLSAAPSSSGSDGVRLHVRVTDGGATQIPAPRAAAPDSVDGRGLAIVEALSSRWGVDRDETGQCVWAELRS
jgi:anti-sigma regulatory factor (Ser/Thr protein kinase)